MKLATALLATACVLALAASASAQLSGSAALGYGHIELNGVGINEGVLNGALAMPLDMGINLEGDVGYEHLTVSNNGVDGANTDFNIGGTAFWADPMFRAGATVNYFHIAFGTEDGTADAVNYGAFAEAFLGGVTLGAKGGGYSGSGNSGGYAGGEVVGYAMPDFALSGMVDYTKLNGDSYINGASETDFTAQGEWLVSENVPISIYAGYTYTSFSNAAFSNANIFFLGVRFYLNPTDGTTLEDRQRTGTVGWGASFSPFGANL